MPTPPSQAGEQQNAEKLVIEQVAAALGTALRPRRLHLLAGAYVDVDGVSDDEGILVEVFAHQGALKGGQRHKIATDVLKLITVARERAQAPRLILAFADPTVADWTAGKSWLAAAVATWGVEVMTAELDESARAGLRAAQVRQVMVNPPDDEVQLPGAVREFLIELTHRFWSPEQQAMAVGLLPASMPAGKVTRLLAGGSFGYLLDGRLDLIDGRVCLEVLEDNRMSGPSHYRIWEDGTTEELPTPSTAYVLPDGGTPEQLKRIEAEYYDHNRAVGQALKERGFR